jgi:hypothetical protein
MRRDKIPTVMFTKKYEEPEQQYHCKYHPGCRMVRIATGLHCQICGGVEVAIRTIILNDPSSLRLKDSNKQRSDTN